MGLGTVSRSSTPGDCCPCCDASAPADGCTCKEVVQQGAAVRFGEHNAELQPQVFVYILDTHSCPMEKVCYQDCKIKHAKVRKCQVVNFPTRLCICIMIQSLITQLHTFFHRIPASLCAQDVHCCLNEKLLNILFSPYCFSRHYSGRAMKEELLVALLFCFLARLHHSISGHCFMNTL